MSFTWNQLQKQFRLKARNFRVLVIDGLIGAGKSTLLASLKKKLNINACFIKEPSDIWEKTGSIEQFYSDPKRYGIEFQVMVTATRIKSCIDAVSSSEKYDLFILERSILTDRAIFMEIQRMQTLTVSMTTYETWWELAYESLPFDMSSAIVVYLRPSMNMVMDRVKERARHGEIEEKTKVETKDETKEKDKKMGSGGVSQEYQEMLQQAHDAYLLNKDRHLFPKMPKFPGNQDQVTVIESHVADQDFRDNQAGQDAMVNVILDVIYKRWPELKIEMHEN